MPPFIQKRRNLYYARLRVPEDLRGHFKKLEFFKTLGTSDKEEAEAKALIVVSGWKRQIAAARGSLGELEKMAAEIRLAHDPKRDDPDVDMTDKDWFIESVAEGIEDEDQEARFRAIAQGIKTPFVTFLDKFLEEWDVDQKTKSMAASFIRKLGDHFPSIESIKRPDVLRVVKSDRSSNGTKTKNFAFARRYWKYLEDEGIVDQEIRNPFSELKLKTKKKKSDEIEREAFEKEDVERIYCEALNAGDLPLCDLIFLVAYTGARIEELCGLKVTDLKKKSGVEILMIKDAKTRAGVRNVPIHPDLKPVIKRLTRDSSDDYLITEQQEDQFGKRSNAIGKRFGRLKTKLGFGKEHVFHSIRKTVITILENAGVPEGVSADIVGHEKKTMTYGLYSAGTSEQKKLEAIKLLKFRLKR